MKIQVFISTLLTLAASAPLMVAANTLSTDNPSSEYMLNCIGDRCKVVQNNPDADIKRTCKNPKQIALSFDDGPSDNIPYLLDILDFYEVKATIFIQGKNLGEERHRLALQRAFEAGHQIANHSFDHPDFTTLTGRQIEAQVRGTQTAIEVLIGPVDKFVRPPYGYYNDFVIERLTSLGFTTVLWNIDPRDWDTDFVDGAMILDRISQPIRLVNRLSNVHSGFIVLQHDWVYETILQVPNIVEVAKAQGYEFVTMSECLKGTEPTPEEV